MKSPNRTHEMPERSPSLRTVDPAGEPSPVDRAIASQLGPEGGS